MNLSGVNPSDGVNPSGVNPGKYQKYEINSDDVNPYINLSGIYPILYHHHEIDYFHLLK